MGDAAMQGGRACAAKKRLAGRSTIHIVLHFLCIDRGYEITLPTSVYATVVQETRNIQHTYPAADVYSTTVYEYW
jgi:hypothetical protein